MKNRFLYTMLAAVGLCWSSCSEDDFSKDYDIEFPVAIITSASKHTPFVEEDIKLEGENLNTIDYVAIGAYKFPVKSIAEDGTSMIVTTPRVVNAGSLTLVNIYKREFNSEIALDPRFYPAEVSSWPSEIEKGRPFTLKGENMDLIREVRVNGTVVSTSGSPTRETAAYSTNGVEMEVGEEVIIEVTPKAGDKQASEAIKVVKPKDTFLPRQTLMVLDTNLPYTVENGDGAAFCEMKVVDGFFGEAFRVTAASGSGWDNTYCKIYSDNGGNGFDLSAYNKPHITILINTYDAEGYMQPLTYDEANGEQDRHLTGAFGYGDDYKSKTDGWEWRSYDLAALGFPVVKGKIDKIGVQFRGGNINGTPFDIAVNRVMITDGPLNPTVAWDCETAIGTTFTLKNTGEGGLEGVSQGSKFASFTRPISGGWDWMADETIEVEGLDAAAYENGIWFNMLINTGHNNGNCQLEFGQDGQALNWFNFIGSQGYGDDYKFKSTENKWEWRSVQIDPDSFDMDSTQPFYVKIGLTTGNHSEGIFELNVDYVVFTTAPMDPNLNTTDL